MTIAEVMHIPLRLRKELLNIMKGDFNRSIERFVFCLKCKRVRVVERISTQRKNVVCTCLVCKCKPVLVVGGQVYSPGSNEPNAVAEEQLAINDG